MACINSFFQNILCYFNTVLSLPVGLRIPRRLCNVFKLVLGSKLLKLRRVELWAVVSGESVSKTMSCQMRFQLDVKFIWNNWYLNCGFRWKWKMIIAINFPIWAIGKKKPEKIRASTELKFVTSAISQFKYELFQIYFTSFHSSREIWTQ